MIRKTITRAVMTLCFVSVFLSTVFAEDSNRIETDISYKNGDSLSGYEKERCKLDLYLPGKVKDFPVLVWFHGGGITGGHKSEDMTVSICKWFAGQGIAVAAVNYRLSPKVNFPAYIDDCAASVAWTVKNIKRYGGNPKHVFVSGHSAGGYLTAMLGVDLQYLGKYGIALNGVAAFLPVSGQMVTHSTVREERGIPKTAPVIDKAAPSYYAAKDLPPFLNICGGSKDLPARAEENRYFVAAMKAAGNTSIESLELEDRDHGTIVSKIPEPDDAVGKAMVDFMRRVMER